MNLTLKELLDLVGKLDDSPGEDSPKERFRNFIKKITDVGQIRDYISECLRYTDEQFNKALQDLVNYIGNFLGFDIKYGRYRGISGEIGYDGLWKSPLDFNIVIEVKKTEVYSIKTNILTNYIDSLISEKVIDNWNNALGLYVLGISSDDIKQLENTIIAEKRSDQLRIVSVESLLRLAEIKSAYQISHKDILSILKPMSPRIDPIVYILENIVTGTVETEENTETEIPIVQEEGISYWMTPVKDDDSQTAIECIKTLVEEEKIYAFSPATPNRRKMKPGDRICFYANTIGIVADAVINEEPNDKITNSKIRNSEKYTWIIKLKSPKLYLNKPIVIDAKLRAKLEAFTGKNIDKNWAWFVQATRKVSENDFKTLTKS